MAFTTTWNASYETLPTDTENFSDGAARIRNVKESIRERMEKDHYMDVTGTDADHGEHSKVTYNAPLGADPSNVANKGFTYTKDVSGVVELFWLDESGNVIQLTSGGVPVLDAGLADTIAEKTADTGVTVDGVLLKDSEVTTDVIKEKTGAAGVTVDGALLKDNQIHPVAGVGPVPFRGALAYLSADSAVATATPFTVLFDSEDYDTDSIHGTGSNTERLTVPAGVTKVRLTGQVYWENVSGGYRYAIIYKNGSLLYAGNTQDRREQADSGQSVQNFSSPVITVAATDYFEIRVYQTSGGSINVKGDAAGGETWFAMEIVE